MKADFRKGPPYRSALEKLFIVTKGLCLGLEKENYLKTRKRSRHKKRFQLEIPGNSDRITGVFALSPKEMEKDRIL